MDKVVKLVEGGSVINGAYPVYFSILHTTVNLCLRNPLSSAQVPEWQFLFLCLGSVQSPRVEEHWICKYFLLSVICYLVVHSQISIPSVSLCLWYPGREGHDFFLLTLLLMSSRGWSGSTKWLTPTSGTQSVPWHTLKVYPPVSEYLNVTTATWIRIFCGQVDSFAPEC